MWNISHMCHRLICVWNFQSSHNPFLPKFQQLILLHTHVLFCFLIACDKIDHMTETFCYHSSLSQQLSTSCYIICCTSKGWKVHRLTEKELCNSNKTWHALNSTFPDTCTNCIVSLQINPHWISNSGTSSTRDISKWRGRLTKGQGSPVSPVVDHHPYFPDLAPSDYFLFPQIKKKALGLEAASDWWWGHICSWGLFEVSGWELLYHSNPSALTPMEGVCGDYFEK